MAVELLACGELPGVEPVEGSVGTTVQRSSVEVSLNLSSGSVPPMNAESVNVPDASSFIVEVTAGGSSFAPGE